MKIVIHTAGLLKDEHSFITECFQKLALQNKKDDFILVSLLPIKTEFSFPKNFSIIHIETNLSNPVLWKLWYDYRLPSLLKKNKADVLISADGICSLRSKIPQCVFIPQSFSKDTIRSYKKRLPASLKKANSIISFTETEKKALVQRYRIDENKITFAYPFYKTEVENKIRNEKELIKEKYTEGKEFFFCLSTSNKTTHLVNLLKAFSFFKKRQKSNMQLILCLSSLPVGLNKSLQSYKYREEIKVLTDIDSNEMAKLMAAAYAFVYPFEVENDLLPLIMALNFEIPVITSDNAAYREICAGAALYEDEANHESFANHLMLIFKDEKKRNELIEKGRQQLLQFNEGETLNTLWSCIQKSVQQ
jgi:glycosyltransferase involved in cell wall biosynthesis